MDRRDIQHTCRELAVAMAHRTQRHMTALKRLARHLRLKLRLVQNFVHQDTVTDLVCWADSDHAGCVRTRKSTSGGVIMHGKHVLKTCSKGQAARALSSAEAEYYGLVSAVSHLLGEISLAKDWGLRMFSRIFMDATAGIAIGSRRGLGRVKHIDAVFLWAQHMVTEARIKLGKVSTEDMLADVLTKHVPEATMVRMIGRMYFTFMTGRHELGLAS
jgi:hypothetical protein